MAIPSQKVIRIGLPNQAQNSDSLYEAFNKTQENFTSLFSYASPYTNFVPLGDGIDVIADANTGSVVLQNTGVTQIIPGSGITVSGGNGAVIISSTGGGGGGNASGTVTSVNITSNSFTVSGGPITTIGTLNVDIPSRTVTTTSTTRTRLFAASILAPTGYEFLIKAVNANTGQINLERLTVVSSNGNCNFTRFGQVDLGLTLGTPDAVMLGTTLEVGITPVTDDPIIWTLQYQKI